MGDYKISLVIPCYNQEKYLKRAINSVINQSIGFENIELLLIDDCSTDNTQELIKQYALKYENIKGIFFNNNNGGPSRSRNSGIKNSNGEFVMFLDQDDYYLEDACEILYNEIKKDDTIEIVQANEIHEFKNEYLIPKVIKLNYLSTNKSERNITSCGTIYKRQFIIDNKIEFPEELKVADDIIFDLDVCLKAKKIFYLNDYYNRVYNSDNSSSLTHKNDQIKSISDQFKTFKMIYNKLNNDLTDEESTLIDNFLNNQLKEIIGSFLRSSTTNENKLSILKKLYKIESYSKNFNPNLSHFWAKIMNNLIIKKKYNIAIFLSNISAFLFDKKIFIKLFRNVGYQKISDKEKINILNWNSHIT